jgi:hypothetical protein
MYSHRTNFAGRPTCFVPKSMRSCSISGRHSSYAIAFTRYAIWHACILFWGSAPFAPSPNSWCAPNRNAYGTGRSPSLSIHGPQDEPPARLTLLDLHGPC